MSRGKRFTDADEAIMRELDAKGMDYRQIAECMKRSPSGVFRRLQIIKGEPQRRTQPSMPRQWGTT